MLRAVPRARPSLSHGGQSPPGTDPSIIALCGEPAARGRAKQNTCSLGSHVPYAAIRPCDSAQLEDLLAATPRTGADLADAAYPPGADPARGPLRFVVPSRGGLLILVDEARYRADDFRLAVLFERGRCLFASVDDFREFCHGPLAGAFGITPEEATAATVQPHPGRRPSRSRACRPSARGSSS